MRLANFDNRAALIRGDGALDLEVASQGRFGPDMQSLFESWETFLEWSAAADLSGTAVPIDRSKLLAPSPAPRQVFAIGVNYRDHAEEAGLAVPDGVPPVFTKYPTCLAGAETTVTLPRGGHTDWEVELVVIIGKPARCVDAAQAWNHVAGLTVGQDLSERISQLQGPVPQFSLGKSFTGFGPTGPWLVTPDEFATPDDLEIGCSVDGEVVQQSRTSNLIRPVSWLIAALSEVLTLLAGDVIFTGTPGGVGLGRAPQRFIRAGDTVRSWIEGIGEITQTFIDSDEEKAS